MKIIDRIHHLKISVFTKWLGLQVLFLLALLLVVLYVVDINGHTLEESMTQLYVNKVRHMSLDLDGLIGDGLEEANKFAIDPLIPSAGGGNGPLMSRSIPRLVDEFKKTNASIDIIMDSFAWFENQDFYITSQGAMDEETFQTVYDAFGSEFFQTISDNQGIDSNQGNSLGDHIYPISLLDGRPTILLLVDMIDNPQVEGKIGIVMSPDIVDSRMRQSFQEEDEMYVFTLEDQVLFRTSVMEDLVLEDYEIFDFQSDETGILLKSYVDKGKCYRQLFSFQKLSIFIIGLAAFGGIIIAYYITLIKYKPIRNLANRFEEISGKDLIQGDVFDRIGQGADHAIYHKKVLESHEQMIIDSFLSMILDGDIKYDEGTDYVKNLVGMGEEGPYCVALSKSINVFAGIEEVYCLHKHPYYVCIAHRSFEDFRSCLEESLSKCSNCTLVSMGPEVGSVQGIIDSYQIGLGNVYFRLIPGKTMILTPDHAFSTAPLHMSKKDELRFLGLVQAGNEEEARGVLEDMVKEGTGDPFVYQISNYLAASMLILLSEELGEEEILRLNRQELQESLALEDMGKIKATMVRIIKRLCDRYSEKAEKGPEILNQRLLAMIQEDLCEPELSPDYLGDALNMNSAYLRQFFLQHNHMPIWDYIHEKRIGLAKVRLVHTKRTILKISGSCGYTSISTFTRTFKKYTGMTPGKYREWGRLEDNISQVSEQI